MQEFLPRNLVAPVGDHLVDVHVALRAASGLPYHQRKLLVQFSTDDLVAGLADGGKLRVSHLLRLQVMVGQGGRLLQIAKGMDDLLRHGLDPDTNVEVLVATLGLGTPELVGGNFHLAHRIMFNAIFHFPSPQNSS